MVASIGYCLRGCILKRIEPVSFKELRHTQNVYYRYYLAALEVHLTHMLAAQRQGDSWVSTGMLETEQNTVAHLVLSPCFLSPWFPVSLIPVSLVPVSLVSWFRRCLLGSCFSVFLVPVVKVVVFLIPCLPGSLSPWFLSP